MPLDAVVDGERVGWGRDVGNVVVTRAGQDIDEGTSAMHDIAEQYYRPGTA